MKKLLSTIVLFLCLCMAARAQVFIINDNIFQGRLSEIKATVLDSLTKEPVAFASVYVIPSKDTTITNFTLSDAAGEAKLEDVPYGSYVLHVEMMGYKPFVKERYFRDELIDMGTIKLQVDEHFLQAATVTDVGNPIVIKQDTVEFNASSYRVGANAMLKDLLRRMPGMEITEDGKVKFNGEEIDKLTVGGRTFFFKDQSTALNNLPAAVVDKIRVIDRESEATRASGIQDGSREKVLDVGLKKEYEKGWFGNVGLGGGTTVASGKADEPLRDNRGLLYKGNALVSAYSEQDQLTVIANVQNINDSDVMFMIIDDDGEETSSMSQGLTTAAQLGVNVNTSRIKKVESTASANYKYTDTDSGTQVHRTTYQDDGNLSSSTSNTGKSYTNSVSGNMEFKKEEGKVWFHIMPSLMFSKTNSLSSSSSETLWEESFVNSANNSSHSLLENKYADFDSDFTFRELWGKEKRSLRLSLRYGLSDKLEDSEESSVLSTVAGKDVRALTYDGKATQNRLSGGLRYSEPFGEKWMLSVSADVSWAGRNNVRDAFDALGKNDYYSSKSLSKSWAQEYELTAQYKFGERSWITLGGSLTGMLNETYSKSFGVEETTGKGEWSWFLTPSFRFQFDKDMDRLSLSASGYGMRPAVSKMLPVLSISNPSRLSVGNVYLKPYALTYMNARWSRNNRKKFSTLMVYMYCDLYTNPVTQALWYDDSGILYSVPVNAKKPNVALSQYLNYTTPLDAGKKWSLSLRSNIRYSFSSSYQARTSMPGLDKDSFDYSDFMADFWGGSTGDRFYGGASGFSESLTRTLSPSLGFSIKYNAERGSVGASASSYGQISRYSLDPSINMNTLETEISVDASYVTKHEFEFETDLGYAFYNGYAPGYGQPEWRWNATITKSIGAFNLSLSAHDILNQTRSLTHTVTANYEEDSYRLAMGRYILFGVKWNFGKMNAAHSQRAQDAAWNMIF